MAYFSNLWTLLIFFCFPVACEAMEGRLQVLGKRWGEICRWMEEQWLVLQELLLKWQHFTDEQFKFFDWLAQKEAILGKMRLADLSDTEQVIGQVKELKVRPSHLYTYPTYHISSRIRRVWGNFPWGWFKGAAPNPTRKFGWNCLKLAEIVCFTFCLCIEIRNMISKITN